jgi:hypothetical protein
MHIMRPVFDDLLRELQRSTSHYSSLNPDNPITQIIGLGSTFRIPGLRSYLKDQLGIPIVRLESFQKIRVEGASEGEFSQHSAMKFATAVGLALQGLGFGSVKVNLSPVGNLREQVWMRKSKWFVAAAVLMCLASAAMFIPLGGSVSGEFPVAVRAALADGKKQVSEFEEAKAAADVGSQANNFIFLLEDRQVWPWIVADVNAAISSAGVQEELIRGFDPSKPPIPVEEWKSVELGELSGAYQLASGGAAAKRSIEVTMRVSVARDLRGAKEFVQGSILEWLNKNADRPEAPYVIVVPPSGFVPEFTALDAQSKSEEGGSTAGGSSSGGFGAPGPAGGGDSGPVGPGGMQTMGRNRGEAGSLQTGKQRPGAMGAGGANPFGTGGADAPASQPKNRERKAARANVQSTAAEPVSIDADAAIPAAPNHFVGKPLTGVTIRFTVQLRDPVGRSVSPPVAAEGAGQ